MINYPKNYEAQEIKHAIDDLYQSLENGIEPRKDILEDIFAFNLNDNFAKTDSAPSSDFTDLERSLKEARKNVAYDTNLFEYDSIEEILQG